MAAEDVEGKATIQIQAPPEKVYDMITDVTRMGEWSPETVRAEWVGGATGPAVGARFKGHNKLGLARWSTTPTVKVADPGKEFTFETGKPGKEATRWTYRFMPKDGGTALTESFEALRYGAFMKLTAKPEKRAAKLTGDIQQTLERIKRAAEGTA
ncbi:MAG TPA: SRPBCC family protein [Acidimicrobiia bacterium]|nr:SRPBCC family protein [Acidimicrobiia bacterium]